MPVWKLLAGATNPGACASADANGVARLFEMTSDLLAAISLDGRFTLLNPAWADAARLERRGADGPADAGARASRRSRADARADARRAQPQRAARELHQPLPSQGRLVALAVVERALRRRGLVRGRPGRDRPHVARAPGAARPAHEAAQPPAVDGPRPPGARPAAPQQGTDRAAVHRPRRAEGDQRQPRARRRRPAARSRSPSAWPRRCATRTRSRDWAATSS